MGRIYYLVCSFLPPLVVPGFATLPLHGLFDVWMREARQGSGFTAEPGWLERGWETLAAHLFIKLPRVFESDIGGR